MPESEHKLVQLRSVLIERFFPLLPGPRLPGLTHPQIEQNKLSKSLAAFAVCKLADIDELTAAGTVIDDFDDNGVDAIYYDRLQHRLILVQSKFRLREGEPDQADVEKFAGGIQDLLNGRYERFNEQFQNKLTDIEEALDDPSLKIVAALAYTSDTLSLHPQRVLDDLQAEVNRFAPRLVCEQFTLERAHEMLSVEHARTTVDVSLILENWFATDLPHRAFYGQVSAAQLAQLFTQHGKSLFERNIRYYVGLSSVNTAIARTLREEPEKMFYLNNGLTAICTSIAPKPTARPERGEFVIEGFSIVNGAQTVGVIASVAASVDLIASPAKVFITLIELSGATDDFGTRVTQARNYQNQVRIVDFAALDPNQEKLRRELAISGATYHYRPSLEALRRDDNTFTLEEAALALACFSGKTELAVAAKKEIGRIWDRQGTIYPQLFKDTTSAVWVCRAVRIFRFLNSIMESNEAAAYGRYAERMFYRHARYLILHILARKSKVLRKPELAMSQDDKLTLSRELNEYATLIFNEAEKLRGCTGYLALSRNMSWAVPLAESVMKALTEREGATIRAESQISGDTAIPE